MFDADELVISKVGKDATNASLPDTDKIFDSKWLFGLQVLGSGVWTYPKEVSTYRDFTLPDYGFQPALMIRTKARPHYKDNGVEYQFALATDRPNISVFTGVEFTYDRTNSITPHKFVNDTTVRIYRTDPYSAVEFHWLALAL
ncbi:hypothetical protein OEG84_25030 [Hoeflea sp. G2-23]|uniref:TonB-dependent receptor-like beta-barrel domain-containing protein n=1 Tax=Hoeflea algicola TaxID=2983763 RepID=A0ABT3Z341_9HYPH|nr:hypothetical protein [Hoeflea algicola]MCY0146144.1 hypothetical protein [Hoeflea algicola]MCY0150872.1 hypothetical protein [Hoeflea algicola]